MTPRHKMMAEMDAINKKIEQMTDLIEEDIIGAITALKNKDVKMARKIVDKGDVIDDLEDEIQADCFKFLATQAPIASDLRYCISVMKLVRDLERIGDHCEDLSKYVIRLDKETYEDEIVDLPRMADLSAKMVKYAIQSFLDRDLRLARKVWKGDEEVDEMFKSIYEEELDQAEKGQSPKKCIMLAFIAAHLERIADYATNICEETVFSLEGEKL